MLSSQIQSAWTLIKTLDLDLPSADDIHNVIILGMGGSAIGGDLVAGLIADECKTPIMVHPQTTNSRPGSPKTPW